jgi:hypothetical protein
MGVEDVPLAEDEASGDLADLALGGGDPEPSVGVGSVEGVPGGVRLPAGPHQASGRRELPSEPSADRQRGEGGGVQDGVQPAPEAFGDGVEGGQRIVEHRVIDVSGVWSEVHRSYLQSKRLPEERTQEGSGKKSPRKAA